MLQLGSSTKHYFHFFPNLWCLFEYHNYKGKILNNYQIFFDDLRKLHKQVAPPKQKIHALYERHVYDILSEKNAQQVPKLGFSLNFFEYVLSTYFLLHLKLILVEIYFNIFKILYITKAPNFWIFWIFPLRTLPYCRKEVIWPFWTDSHSCW